MARRDRRGRHRFEMSLKSLASCTAEGESCNPPARLVRSVRWGKGGTFTDKRGRFEIAGEQAILVCWNTLSRTLPYE